MLTLNVFCMFFFEVTIVTALVLNAHLKDILAKIPCLLERLLKCLMTLASCKPYSFPVYANFLNVKPP